METTCSNDSEDNEKHAETVPPNITCLICYDDINETNYIEYKTNEHSEWHPSYFCLDCTNLLIKSQYHQYINSVQKTECKREQKALLNAGPPINVKDKNGFPESEGKELFSLWYFSDKKIHSAKLDGSLEGEERKKLWEELKKFLVVDENTAES